MAKTKNKAKQHIENPLEKLFNLDDILGFTSSEDKQKAGDKKAQAIQMEEGKAVSFKKPQEEQQKQEEIQTEAGIDYLRSYSREISQVAERSVSHERQEIEMQLREIMLEIKKLADGSKALQMQFKEVAVAQHIATPGKYHKNFFSWLLSVIRTARMRVEDSGAWLSAAKGKHAKKGSYWAQADAKVGGTSFSLSGERNVSNQVG